VACASASLICVLHGHVQHTDLHPGNILVRLRTTGPGRDDEEAPVANIDDVLLRPIAKGQARAQLQLVSAIHMQFPGATSYPVLRI
jgi:predicted unusual protein kinase regulating ubiquinone biosynthesis (AarF/ABC1/UbiB family)